MNNYKKFALMILSSSIFMFLVMYLNIFQLSHFSIGLTRIYMTLLMVAPMVLIMLFFMKDMYNNSKLNIAIISGSIAIFIISLIGLRSQVLIGDIQWMKAMIPHHSSAILTSSYANLKDPEVQELAQEIIQAQEREIAEMKSMIKRLESK